MESTSFSDNSEDTTTSFGGTENKGFVKENEYAVNIELKNENTSNNDSVEEIKQTDATDPNEIYEKLSLASEEDGNGNRILHAIILPVEMLGKYWRKYEKQINLAFGVFLALGVTAYLIAAMARNFDRAVTLLVLWSLTVGYAVYAYFRNNYGKEIRKALRPGTKFVDDNMSWIQCLRVIGVTGYILPVDKVSGQNEQQPQMIVDPVVFILVVVAGLITWIVLDTSKRPNQLISGAGYFVFLFGLFITSKYPNKVYWRPVFWGGLFQVCFGMFILRTEAGFQAFNWAGMIAQTFINYVDAGVEFVYGPTWADHSFAFKTLSIVIYFSSFISILYHLGIMQWLILKIAWLMQITLRTSATESMVAAGNIFVGQTESPLLIRPFIADLTTSEIFAVMTAGFGTISGSVLGAYLGFGIQPSYVITACVMASPASLAVAKLQYPETKKSKFSNYKDLVLETSPSLNFVEAAFNGVSAAIPLVLNIGANLIAFLGLLAAVNGFLSWFGGLLDFPELSFELMCSYIFVPVTYLMGIEWVDCFKAAELIGIKIFLNEFIAYEDLSEMLDKRDNGTFPKLDANGDVNWVDERTEAIITYALCGFANIGSIGIMLGGLSAMAPKRQGEMASIVVRALMAGIFVSILNSCVAGFLYVPRAIDCTKVLKVATWNEWAIEQDRLHQCCQPLFDSSPPTNASLNCCAFPWLPDYNVTC